MGNKSLGFVCHYSQEVEELWGKSEKFFKKIKSAKLSYRYDAKELKNTLDHISENAIEQAHAFFDQWVNHMATRSNNSGWPLRYKKTTKSKKSEGFTYVTIEMNPRIAHRRNSTTIKIGLEVIDSLTRDNGYAILQFLTIRENQRSRAEECASFINKMFNTQNIAEKLDWPRDGIISYIDLDNKYISKEFNIDLRAINDKLMKDFLKIKKQDWNTIFSFL
jgi:hypothetical protein